MMASARDNIGRVLESLGLGDAVVVTREDEDCIWGWPPAGDDRLLRHVVLNCWNADPRPVTEALHGTAISFREPGGVRPAMQVCFYKAPEGSPEEYWIYIDLDLAAPGLTHPVSTAVHLWQFVENAVTGKKTNQERIAEGLDERLGRVQVG